jgi:WD40 repeat-containing protein SMU1
MALLGQALKWQNSQGLLPPDEAYDLFRGAAPTAKIEDDTPPNQCYQTIKVGFRSSTIIGVDYEAW